MMDNGELRDQARILLLESQKIEAIKLVQERTGWKLKQSKEYVDEIERSMRSLPTAQEPMSDVEIRALVDRGSLVQAVKRVRETTGWGLKEAKEYVDAAAGRGGPSGSHPLEESQSASASEPRLSLFARLFRGRSGQEGP